MPSRVIATLLALVAFAAAIVAGAIAQNTAWTIVWRASLAMLGCYWIGRLMGAVSQRAVHEHLARYKAANPIPAEFQPPVDVEEVKQEEADGPVAVSPAAASRAAA